MQRLYFQQNKWAWLVCCSGVLLAVAIETSDLKRGEHATAQHIGSGLMQSFTHVMQQQSPIADKNSPYSQADTSSYSAVTAASMPPQKMTLGRYVQQINCQSTHCMVPGDVELIMTFLPDGTVHRLLIHMGQMSVHRDYSHSRVPTASLDRWYWNAATQEVSIKTAYGAQFVYGLDAAQQLHAVPDQAQKKVINTKTTRALSELDQAQLQAGSLMWQRSDHP